MVDAAKESGELTNKIEHSGEVSNKIIINGVIPDPKEWERVATLHIENMLQLVARMKEAANDGAKKLDKIQWEFSQDHKLCSCAALFLNAFEGTRGP